ncbi:MAG: tripartite tricarboxylate transporter substrate binding protein BugD [Xanthobacteraceae bacterium]|nr:tripartite tricarboxylate transporter substrate binding protein BugD [Xanthobacteraceae bacterium]
MKRRSFMLSAAAALSAVALPRGAFAQTFPTKPIKIIVPFPPGGPADTAVRIPQPAMEKALGQPIIVENVAGAAGQVGALRVKQAEPDGYTLLQAASPHTTNTAVKPETNVDLLRDFAPIGQTGNSVYTLCASKELGIRTLAEVVARAKAKPGAMTIGSVGIGSAHHLIAEMLKAAAGIELTHVPYRGEAPSIPDLVAGRLDLMFLTTAKPLIDDGRVIGLGVTSDEEWFNLPGVKPLVTLGLKDFVVPGWNGLMAPKGTPPAVVARLSEALSAALSTDTAARGFNNMGFKPGSGTPGPMTKQIEADMRLFTAVIRERNLKFDT